jgi:hypothetical protein
MSQEKTKNSFVSGKVGEGEESSRGIKVFVITWFNYTYFILI